LKYPVGRQTLGDAMVHAVRVNLANGFGPLFVYIFAPNYDSNLVHGRSKLGINKRGNNERVKQI
jgi:hypothetical protein